MIATYPECDPLRKILNVSRVDSGKIPSWLLECLAKEYPDAELLQSCEGQARALVRLLGKLSLDHCGTTKWHGIQSCFVSEPYQVDLEAFLHLREKGRRLGFAVAYDAISYHYPGSCHRVVIFPCTVSLNSASHPAAVLALLDAGGAVEGLTMTSVQKDD